jgi:serine/threonine protein kinase
MEEGVLHRDLAARNVLLFSFDQHDPLSTSVKVADFGLSVGANSRTHVYGAPEENKPLRYMPPEALQRAR